MTLKEFFKSKTFRCILVLLCIALLAGGLLAIMNDLLYVSDEENTKRTVKKIYGTEVDYEEIDTDKDIKFETEDKTGKIEKVYRLTESGNILVRATGTKGYKQGTVSVWCVMNFSDGAFTGISDVSIADNTKQTLMSKFTSKELARYKGTEEFDDADKVSGATMSSRAIHNALNAVLAYAGSAELQEGLKALEGGAK